MSKSENNYIAIEDAPNEMYGKVMSIPDTVMENYYELATDIDVESVKKEIKENPRDAKMKLASEIVTIYHSKEDAKKAEDEFIKTFQKKGTPDDIKEITINSSVENVEALALSFGVSKSEIRRLIKQKGIKMNGKVIEEETKLEDGAVMQKGKRHFVKVIKK
jgi:tyrosyl-tRNA synthetase